MNYAVTYTRVQSFDIGMEIQTLGVFEKFEDAAERARELHRTTFTPDAWRFVDLDRDNSAEGFLIAFSHDYDGGREVIGVSEVFTGRPW